MRWAEAATHPMPRCRETNSTPMTEEFDPDVHDEYDPSEHSFHVDAHPEAKQPGGDRNYGMWGQCVADSNTTDERCGGTAKGPHGKCYWHGGATPTKDENEDVGASEGNTNAEGNAGGDGAPEGNLYPEKHALFVKTNKYYQQVMDDDERDLCDAIEKDYLEDYHEVHGEISNGHALRIFEISVNHIKIIHSDNWAIDKPAALESGSPMVDKETEPVPTGEGTTTKVTYSETVVVGTQQKLRREDRQWLKSYGLLENDPEAQKADSISNLAEVLSEE